MYSLDICLLRGLPWMEDRRPSKYPLSGNKLKRSSINKRPPRNLLLKIEAPNNFFGKKPQGPSPKKVTHTFFD